MGWALIFSLGAMNDFFVKFQRMVYCENGQTLGTITQLWMHCDGSEMNRASARSMVAA